MGQKLSGSFTKSSSTSSVTSPTASSPQVMNKCNSNPKSKSMSEPKTAKKIPTPSKMSAEKVKSEPKEPLYENLSYKDT